MKSDPFLHKCTQTFKQSFNCDDEDTYWSYLACCDFLEKLPSSPSSPKNKKKSFYGGLWKNSQKATSENN